MGLRRMMLSAIAFTALIATVRAGPVTTFTNLDAFLEAAADVHEIDFETLPDGSPSYSGALITPEFNYTDQGVDFFSNAPNLFISGSEISGFNLTAGPEGSVGPRNWIIAEFIEPATAVGIVYPGSTTLSVFDTDGVRLGRWIWGGGGEFFLGILSDSPIALGVVDRGLNAETINSFLFVPIPEPATLVFLGAGTVCLVACRRSKPNRRER